MTQNYNNFKFWLLDILHGGERVYRIQYPDGYKTPPVICADDDDCRAKIDAIIAA